MASLKKKNTGASEAEERRGETEGRRERGSDKERVGGREREGE